MEKVNIQILLLDPTEESALFLYCFKQLLPSAVQPKANERFSNFSYWQTLAVDHQPLRNAALACSAMAMSHERMDNVHNMMSMRQMAWKYQVAAITALRAGINSGAVDGSEIWLLATVNCLAIFEVSYHPFTVGHFKRSI